MGDLHFSDMAPTDRDVRKVHERPWAIHADVPEAVCFRAGWWLYRVRARRHDAVTRFALCTRHGGPPKEGWLVRPNGKPRLFNTPDAATRFARVHPQRTASWG